MLQGHLTALKSRDPADPVFLRYSPSVLKQAAEKINAQEDWGYLDQLAY